MTATLTELSALSSALGMPWDFNSKKTLGVLARLYI
jgi:hypothetical protein